MAADIDPHRPVLAAERGRAAALVARDATALAALLDPSPVVRRTLRLGAAA